MKSFSLWKSFRLSTNLDLIKVVTKTHSVGSGLFFMPDIIQNFFQHYAILILKILLADVISCQVKFSSEHETTSSTNEPFYLFQRTFLLIHSLLHSFDSFFPQSVSVSERRELEIKLIWNELEVCTRLRNVHRYYLQWITCAASLIKEWYWKMDRKTWDVMFFIAVLLGHWDMKRCSMQKKRRNVQSMTLFY